MNLKKKFIPDIWRYSRASRQRQSQSSNPSQSSKRILYPLIPVIIANPVFSNSTVVSERFSVPVISNSTVVLSERFSVPEFRQRSSEKIKKVTVHDKISAVAEDRLAQRDAEIKRNALFHPKEMELKELEVKEKMMAFQHMEKIRKMEIEEREADMEYKRRMRVLDITLKEKEVELMIMNVEMMKKKLEEWVNLFNFSNVIFEINSFWVYWEAENWSMYLLLKIVQCSNMIFELQFYLCRM